MRQIDGREVVLGVDRKRALVLLERGIGNRVSARYSLPSMTQASRMFGSCATTFFSRAIAASVSSSPFDSCAEVIRLKMSILSLGSGSALPFAAGVLVNDPM